MSPLLALTLGIAVARAEAPACEGAPDAWLQTLVEGPDKQAYLCLAASDAAYTPLFEAASAENPDANVANRMTRAFAVHLMQRLERPLTAEEVRALDASDRRLVRDAVYARRGRATPSKTHQAVFEQFDWYRPDSGFTNGRLTDLDRQNIELLDDPPPAPKAAAPAEEASAAAAVAEAQQGPVVPKGMCGCSSAGALGLGPLLLPLWALGRRRRG